jgi:hypothetical protein
MDLISKWANWRPESAPYILPDDEPIITALTGQVTQSWADHIQCANFGAPGDKVFHLGLLPHPYCGDLRNASIYILMLNPGLGPTDYYGEYNVPEYRTAILANIRQEFSNGLLPFMFLDPRFSWHAGFNWWHSKLDCVILQLSRVWDIAFAEARARLAHEIASVELVPYHSAGFKNERGVAKRLPSAQFAARFVMEFVLPRVRDGNAVVIVARKVAVWDLPDLPGVVKYTGGEARGAHLSVKSRGGEAIIAHLTNKALRPR